MQCLPSSGRFIGTPNEKLLAMISTYMATRTSIVDLSAEAAGAKQLDSDKEILFLTAWRVFSYPEIPLSAFDGTVFNATATRTYP